MLAKYHQLTTLQNKQTLDISCERRKEVDNPALSSMGFPISLLLYKNRFVDEYPLTIRPRCSSHRRRRLSINNIELPSKVCNKFVHPQ